MKISTIWLEISRTDESDGRSATLVCSAVLCDSSHASVCASVGQSHSKAIDCNCLIWNPRREWRQTNERRGYTLNECSVFAKRETKRNPNINYEFVLHNSEADLLRYLLKVFALQYTALIKDFETTETTEPTLPTKNALTAQSRDGCGERWERRERASEQESRGRDERERKRERELSVGVIAYLAERNRIKVCAVGNRRDKNAKNDQNLYTKW